MKEGLYKIIVIVLLGLIVYFNITNSCSGADVNRINNELRKTRAEIAEVNDRNQQIMMALDSLAKKRYELNNYYKYEITKIDSIYTGNASYSVVDSIIRYWTGRIYNIPGFFNNTKQTGPAEGKQDSTRGGELLLPGIKFERGE